MKIRFLVILYLVLSGFVCISQKSNINKTDTLCQKKITGMLSVITDITYTKNISYSSCGLGGAMRINDKLFVGIYGLGLMSYLNGSDFNNSNESENYQLSFSHGGIWFGYISSYLHDFSFSTSLKAGYGAVFMYDPRTTIDFFHARDELLIIMPSIDTEIYLKNWLKLNVGLGIKFIHGFSTRYMDKNGNNILYFKSSALEGANVSFSLFFGSFCRNKK